MEQTLIEATDATYHLPAHWTTVGLLTILLTYADGFWLTVIQGAVGAIQRFEPPFTRWLRVSTLLLPLFVLVVFGALWLARRWFGRTQRALVGLGATVLLVTLISGGVGLAVVTANSAYDFSLQRQHLAVMIQSHGANHPVAGNGAGAELATQLQHVQDLGGVSAGPSLLLLEYSTLMAHVRALGYATVLILVTNLVLTIGVLALWDDRFSTTAPHNNWATS
ncbi:MAG: hypothetical protein U0350_28420 [Caldilineaceae bacterium]